MDNVVSLCLDEFPLQFPRIKRQNGCEGKEPSIRCGQTGTFHQLHQSQLLSNTSDEETYAFKTENKRLNGPDSLFALRLLV